MLRLERQAAKRFAQGLLARQRNRADAALVVVDDDALQHVVDLIAAHAEGQSGVAARTRLVLEVADAARREHHAAELKPAGLTGLIRLRQQRARRENEKRNPETHLPERPHRHALFVVSVPCCPKIAAEARHLVTCLGPVGPRAPSRRRSPHPALFHTVRLPG